MARVTTEDCTTSIPNRFQLVIYACRRARELTSGSEVNVSIDNDKNTVIALREIAEETITVEHLKNDLIEEYQTNTFTEDEDLDEIEDSSDENQSQEGELDIDEINQDKSSINQLVEETSIETSQDNLKNSSDEDKEQDI